MEKQHQLLSFSHQPFSPFTHINISDDYAKFMIHNNIWNESCPVSIDRLRLVSLSYCDFDGTIHNDGLMMVMDVIAPSVIKIFQTLLEQKFPISKIRLIDSYNSLDKQNSDFLSMNDNNTVCFQNRTVMHSSNFSIHAYGLAIDINPHQNGFITFETKNCFITPAILPNQSAAYLNRLNIRPGMVESHLNDTKTKSVVDLFKQNGFTVWGGFWNDPIDWHHFQLPKDLAQNLASMNGAQAKTKFEDFLKKI